MAYKFNPTTGQLDIVADNKSDVGLSNVDNTSDADKPISTATAAALAGKTSTGSATTSGLTMATARLLGRTTAGAGALEEIQVVGGTFANGVLTTLPSSLTADANGNLTFTARWIQSMNGAASAPAHALTGTWFTGGTSTTTKPQFLIEPAGTTSTNWSTAGTGLGVNAASGFSGDFLSLKKDGKTLFRVNSNGKVSIGELAPDVYDVDVYRTNSAASLRICSTYSHASLILSKADLSSDALLTFTRTGVSSEWQVGTKEGNQSDFLFIFTGAERFRLTDTGNFRIANSGNIETGTTTGTKIGTATTQKLAFWNATPIVQPAAVADATDNASAITQLNLVLARLRSLGLIAT